MSETVDQLIAYCQENGRVCPQPSLWNDFWEQLPDRNREGAGWVPALPLILAAWHHSSDSAKRMRLEEHIHWADQPNGLEQASAFLQGLNESEWYYLGE
jgi:hypothetical protein